jgi:hypothetical protein
MKKNLALPACILILLPCLSWAPLWGADFGVILDQTAAYSGSKSDIVFGSGASESDAPAFEYSGALIPWFSALAGDKGGIYISASAKADWKNDTLSYAPELLRTEFSWDFDNGELKLGRMQYVDPLGIIAAGLFDGAKVSIDLGEGSISAGAWYTGLLYKERAHITITPEELQSYNTVIDYDDFTNTYFAPHRAFAALGWEHRGMAGLAQAQFALLGQFDLAAENALNSQYLAGKVSVPIDAFVFTMGGCLELMEYADEYKIALMGELGITYMFTASRFSLSGRYSSGRAEDRSLMEFIPLTTVDQGNILNAKLSGLSVISLDYLSRLHQTFSAGITASCFLRSDLGTYNGYPVAADGNTDDNILGTELFARLLWSPVSDIQINMGGGGFLPAMGNTNRNAPILWRVELNLILALY